MVLFCEDHDAAEAEHGKDRDECIARMSGLHLMELSEHVARTSGITHAQIPKIVLQALWESGFDEAGLKMRRK